jgi:hypothetical protein
MENYPEYSGEMWCIGWNYKTGRFTFQYVTPHHDQKTMAITIDNIITVLPAAITYLSDINSSDYNEPCNWDSCDCNYLVKETIKSLGGYNE